MHITASSVLIIFGLILLIGSQLAIALHAFTRSPVLGSLCLFVPLYIYVYARKHKVGIWLMRGWYAGIAVFIIGGVLST